MDAVVCIRNWKETQLPYYIILPNFTRWKFMEKSQRSTSFFLLQYVFCLTKGQSSVILQIQQQLRLVLGGVVPWYQGLFNCLAQMIGDSGVANELTSCYWPSRHADSHSNISADFKIQICIWILCTSIFFVFFTANHDYNSKYCNNVYIYKYFLYLMQNCIPLVCNYVSLYFLKFVWIARFGICTSTRLSDSQQIRFGNPGLPRWLVVVSTMFVFAGLGNKPNDNVPTCFHINW